MEGPFLNFEYEQFMILVVDNILQYYGFLVGGALTVTVCGATKAPTLNALFINTVPFA